MVLIIYDNDIDRLTFTVSLAKADSSWNTVDSEDSLLLEEEIKLEKINRP